MAVLQQEGLKVPPRTSPAGPTPMDPKLQLEHQTTIEGAKIAADLDKHKATVAADIEKEKIRSAAKAQQAKVAQEHAFRVAQTLRDNKPKKRTITKKGEGKYEVEE